MSEPRTIFLFAEGRADLAVLENVLYGALPGEELEFRHMLPDLDFDETDKAHLDPNSFSSWTVIKKECLEKNKLAAADLLAAEQDFIVLHIDAAERYRSDFGFDHLAEPRDAEDCATIACGVGLKVSEWLAPCAIEKLIFAVAVNETDAWLLAHYDDQRKKDTGTARSPKERLRDFLRISDKKWEKIYSFQHEKQKYHELSRPLKKTKDLRRAAERNVSLKMFLQSIHRQTSHHPSNPS
jgi:hypothetical protein